MTDPILPALHLSDPAARLRPGSRVRVKLASEGPTIEGTLREIDEHGLTVERRQPYFRTEVDWSDDTPTARRVRWVEVEGVWVRGRAILRGATSATVLALALGWCGDSMDQLTDGFPRAEMVYVGIGIGGVIGGLVMLLGHEWSRVDHASMLDDYA